MRLAILALAAVSLTALPASATISSWPYGRWDVILAPAEDILVLSQKGENIEVEARSEGGSDISVSARAESCGDDRVRLGAFTIKRAAWEGKAARDRAAHLKAVFKGWAGQANLLCPDKAHRVDFRKLEAALRQFDFQLAWGKK